MTCYCGADCAFANVKDEIIYEIHVTVEDHPDFVDLCKSVGIKPIIIEFPVENIPSHQMTSTVLRDVPNYAAAQHQAMEIGNALMKVGLMPIRLKIETVPWNPEAETIRIGQYFETHFSIASCYADRYLNKLAKFLGCHPSVNAMKKGKDTFQMLTYRSKAGMTKIEFFDNVEIIQNILVASGYPIDKKISEFAIFDTNVLLDEQWMKL